MELFELLFLGMVIGQVRDQKEQKKRYHTQDIEIKQRAETDLFLPEKDIQVDPSRNEDREEQPDELEEFPHEIV